MLITWKNRNQAKRIIGRRKKTPKMTMKVDIIAKQKIKPSTPTPNHLRNFRLSFLDQITPPIYGLIVFFYKPATNTKTNGDQSNYLKKSLSQTLTSFYPFAGRLKDSTSIDCNDEGALFVEAKMGCNLFEFLSQPDAQLINHFLIPTNDSSNTESSSCMALVQLTNFICGGTSISVCLSHKLTDLSTLMSFLHCWTSIAIESCELQECPLFLQDSLLPPKDFSFMSRTNMPLGKLITKRFVFEGSKIDILKAKVSAVLDQIQQQHQYPSRVEVVLSLILKCAMDVSKSIKGCSNNKPSVLFQVVNLRKRLNPPLPENSIGNLFWLFPIVIKEDETELSSLVYKLKKETNEFCKEKAAEFKGEKGVALICETLKGKRSEFKEMETYSCTSWCKFPLYETDFGWGKPIWVSSSSLAFKNTIVMVDTKQGNGIEAWVTLEEENMSIFENNEELLDSAYFNPSVC